MSEFQKEELSLEETNKLRLSLGLKPLVANEAPAQSQTSGEGTSAPKLDADAQAARNFQEKQDSERRQRHDVEVKERLAKAQAKRDAARRLKGPTLGEASGELTSAAGSSSSRDTLTWIKESKKRAKEHAARRAKQLEEDEARAQEEYRDSDLAGLRVRHNADDFGEGEERILTLRDTGVLEDGDDELMDAALDQAERDAKNNIRKSGVKEYTGLDDEETLAGRKRGILAKYDADMPEGEPESNEEPGFRLGATVSAADRQARLRQEAEEAAKHANKQLLSLDYTKNQEVSDYLQEGDVGFKKPKAKKRKKAAKVKLDFEDADEGQPVTADPSSTRDDTQAADVEMEDIKVATRPPRRQQTDNFVDDDELQASLAKSRRQKAKRTFNKMTPEMIAKSLAAQRAAEQLERSAASTPNGTATPLPSIATNAVNDVGDGERAEGGLTFDETSEFVRAIRERPLESDSRSSARSIKRESPALQLDDNAGAQVKSEEVGVADDVAMRELESPNIKTEEEDDELQAAISGIAAVKDESEQGFADKRAGAEDSEPVIGRGMAGTLSFLRQQGMLPQIDSELKSREEQQRRYDSWLAARRREDEDRELARQASKASGSSVDQATREAQNRNRELDDARMAQDRFRDYKPDVEIKYHDEFGRDLDQKEAWKHLSHVFHGKKPGTKKMEKRLKKIEDEKKRERMAAGDTPNGMMSAFQSRSERTGKAHMVLSVGARGSAPQENDLLDGKGGIQLKKAARPADKQQGSGKGKKAEKDTLLSPLPTSGFESNGAASTVTNGDGAATATTIKAGGGWARIGSATPAPSTAPAAMPANANSGFRQVASASASGAASPAVVGTDGEPGQSASSNAPFRLAFSGLKRKAEGS